MRIRFVPLSTKTVDARQLGPFRLEKAWAIDDLSHRYGSYSGLVALGKGRLFSVSDTGNSLEFSAPDAAERAPGIGGRVVYNQADKYHMDAEAATYDPATSQVWVAFEFSNIVTRFTLRDGKLVDNKPVHPPAMRDWGNNTGPESFARLSDGRFLAIREGFVSLLDRKRHSAVLFATDPARDPNTAKMFTFVGPSGFSPTDATQLPDGRVLVLMRRVVWPMPPRFGGAIVIGDPAAIREGREWPVRTLATWSGGLPVDNFEGLAIEPPSDPESEEPLTIWVISDDNRAALQRAVLWKLRLDPADLPPLKRNEGKQKGARDVRTPPVSDQPGKAGL
ncbi:MAG: esterase-like activity of phytase family protein [Novosphingobium sp.]|nr:esterase-like activity of phytase family protein [Novosphingobium sp.]